MLKHIDLKENVYELTETYPELIEILKEMGFLGVANPIARKILGKVTTIPQGCKKQGKDLNEVIKKLKELGFKVKP
ncbi:MAG: DUF1858 domain-containing protein [Candidatus Aminicenantes bacterium]|nr:MAG: DUF1858 domain-containing protein [Candidatus Aminicenantes bacterium]